MAEVPFVRQPIVLANDFPLYPNTLPRDFDLVVQTSILPLLPDKKSTIILPLSSSAPPPPSADDEKNKRVIIPVRHPNGTIYCIVRETGKEESKHIHTNIHPALLVFDLAVNPTTAPTLITPEDDEHAKRVFAINAPLPRPRPPTEEEEKRLLQIRQMDEHELLPMPKPFHEMSAKTFQLLLSGGWVNDNSVSFIMSRINSIVPTAWCFSTNAAFKLRKLADETDEVARWFKDITDPHNKEKLLFPVNTPGHWSLFVVNLRDKRFEFYDSFPPPVGQKNQYTLGETFLGRMKKMLTTAASIDTDAKEWKQEVFVENGEPQQNNGDDCGVFVMVKALFVAADLSSSGVRHEDMPAWRRAIAGQMVRPPASQLHFFL
jgi:hypothetical protein